MANAISYTSVYNFPYPLGTDDISSGAARLEALARRMEEVLVDAGIEIGTYDVLKTSTVFAGDITGLYNALQIGANTITSVELADNSVDSAAIVAGAVTSAKLDVVDLPNGSTATTQSQLDGSTNVATTSYVDTAALNFTLGIIPPLSVTNAMLAGSITYAKLILTNSIVNADVAASAAIAYSKLNLATSIVNADVSASAAIAYSKLNLGTSIVNADINAAAAITYAKLALTGSIVNADVNASAAISYSKLNLATSIVNADVSASAAIAYSKLALTGAILNADLAGSIDPSKVTGTAVVTADSRLSDARTPTAHASTHIPGGTDVLNFSAFSGQGSSLPGSLTLYPAGSLFAVGAAAPYLIYRSNGTSWDQLGASAITTSDTAPATPQAGDLWYQSSTGKQFIRYDSFWVEMGNNTNASVAAHATNHIRGGLDIIDGDRVTVDFVPLRYTRDSSPTEAGATTDLTAHLKGIDSNLTDLSVPPMVRCTQTSGSALIANNWAVIAFNGPDDYDTASLHNPSVNNSRITIPITGVYALVGAIQFNGYAAGQSAIMFAINGTQSGEGQNFTGGIYQQTVTAHRYLTAGQYVELQVYNNIAGTTYAPGTYFSAIFQGKTT